MVVAQTRRRFDWLELTYGVRSFAGLAPRNEGGRRRLAQAGERKGDDELELVLFSYHHALALSRTRRTTRDDSQPSQLTP